MWTPFGAEAFLVASGACGGGSLVGKSLVGSLVGKSPRQFLPHLEQEEGESALFSGAGPRGSSGTSNA